MSHRRSTYVSCKFTDTTAVVSSNSVDSDVLKLSVVYSCPMSHVSTNKPTYLNMMTVFHLWSIYRWSVRIKMLEHSFFRLLRGPWSTMLLLDGSGQKYVSSLKWTAGNDGCTNITYTCSDQYPWTSAELPIQAQWRQGIFCLHLNIHLKSYVEIKLRYCLKKQLSLKQ